MRLALTTMLVGLAAALGASTATAAAAPGAGAPRTGDATVATILHPVTARTRPDRRAPAVRVVQPLAPLGGGRQSLEVLRRSAGTGTPWLQVRLAQRPNGARGWIPAEAAELRRSRHRVVVDLSSRRLTLMRDGRVVMRAPVAIGAAGTPTPIGRFSVAEMIRMDPDGVLGPVVFPLTGFSRHLNEYAGGRGRVAIHGTSAPRLIGTRASHGCVRLRNRDVLRLARVLRPGDPVRIRR